jgi:hypothetical protein
MAGGWGGAGMGAGVGGTGNPPFQPITVHLIQE